MKVLGLGVLEGAQRKHSDWRIALSAWLKVIESTRCSSFVELRQVRPDADFVGGYVVFNIAHNKARLISVVNYALSSVVVTEVLTHREYDSWSARLRGKP
jgi:mRNA interferase HigB